MKRTFHGGVALLLSGILSPLTAADEKADGTPEELLVYIGTYTGGESEGIYLFGLELASGKLAPRGLAAEVVQPSFVAIHPSRKYLYSVSEVSTFDGQKAGGVSAFAVEPDSGKLRLLNQRPSGGGGPCHLVVDQAGRNVLVANYGGGSVACLPIGEDGRLGEISSFIQHEGSSVNPQRQKGPHAHSINLDKAGRFAFAADLGLDKILIYAFDAKAGKLTPHDPAFAKVAPGGGPRHFAFHPSGKFAYTNNEITSSVTAFAYDAGSGTLTSLQTISTLPKGFKANNSTAEVQVHPSGRFLYCSNRGHDSVAIFSIDAKTGKLTHTGNESTRGKTPRNFDIDPTGRYLIAANQSTHNLAVFRVDAKTGGLEFTGQNVEAPNPVCVKMMPHRAKAR